MKRLGGAMLIVASLAVGLVLIAIAVAPQARSLLGLAAANPCTQLVTPVAADDRPLDLIDGRIAISIGPLVGDGWRIFVSEGPTLDPEPITDGVFAGDPSWSPDGTRLAFIDRADDEVDQLWLMDADGSDARQVAGNASWPSWSPDGRTIAYWDAGSYRALDVETGVSRLLVDPEAMRVLSDEQGPSDAPFSAWGRASWSPDGERLVFELSGPNPHSDLAILDVADGRLSRLTDTPRCGEREPAWSPDGLRIAFTTDSMDAHPSDPSAMGEIATIAPDGTDRHILTATSALESAPAWSPDGRVIALTITLPGPATAQIMGPDRVVDVAMINADGSGWTLLSVIDRGDTSGGVAWGPTPGSAR